MASVAGPGAGMVSGVERERLSPEELDALLGGEADPGGTPEEAPPQVGLPPDAFLLLERVARRTLLAAVEDLDDFLDLPVAVQEVVLGLTRGGDVGTQAKGGVASALGLSGALEGTGWLVVPEASSRVLLARLLGAREPSMIGPLGPLHQTALEAPFDELREGMVRHFGEDGLEVEAELAAPDFVPPAVDSEARLVRLEVQLELRGDPWSLVFYLEEGLARSLVDRERDRKPVDEEAADAEADDKARSTRSTTPVAPAVPQASGPRALALPVSLGAALPSATPPPVPVAAPTELLAYLGRASLASGAAGLEPGTLIKLDRLAGETVELVVGGKRVGEAEVLVVDDHYALRVLAPRTGGEGSR